MIDWQAIDTVMLDMDGTLLDLHFDNYFWLHHLPVRYGEVHGIDFEVARTKLAARIQQQEGSLQWYCLEFWSNALDLDIMALKHERSEEHTSELQSRPHLVCRLLLEKKKKKSEHRHEDR